MIIEFFYKFSIFRPCLLVNIDKSIYNIWFLCLIEINSILLLFNHHKITLYSIIKFLSLVSIFVSIYVKVVRLTNHIYTYNMLYFFLLKVILCFLGIIMIFLLLIIRLLKYLLPKRFTICKDFLSLNLLFSFVINNRVFNYLMTILYWLSILLLYLLNLLQ